MVKLSLVYPTSDRPQFLKVALQFLENRLPQDIEIVVADNPSRPELGVEEICNSFPTLNIKYQRSNSYLGMVDNWNRAYRLTTGDYVSFFTDKMFVLPGSLDFALAEIAKSSPDIISWTDSKYSPFRFPNYLGPGIFYRSRAADATGPESVRFSPGDALARRLEANSKRTAMSPQEYCEGKICFGAYSRGLLSRMCEYATEPFHPATPDYTSLGVALSLAESGVTLNRDCIVHLNTDVSQGKRFAESDVVARSFLSQSKRMVGIPSLGLCPNLFASIENIVAGDLYWASDLVFNGVAINLKNWSKHIADDLTSPNRKWASDESRQRQVELFVEYFGVEVEELSSWPSTNGRSPLTSAASLRRVLSVILSNVCPSVVGRSREVKLRERGLNATYCRSIIDLAHPIERPTFRGSMGLMTRRPR